MAASVLGISSTAPFALPAEETPSFRFPSVSAAAPLSSFPTGHSAALCAEFAKEFLRIPSCHPRYASFRTRSSRAPTACVAVPSLSSSEASPSQPSPSSSTEAEAELEPATIDLEFFGPEQGQDSPPMDRVSVTSGEKLLRTIMNEQKLEVYDFYGKVMNCGGGGSCGTCIVEVLEGSELLNERTDAEERYLKKKPNTWRLSCQTIVGDKTNSGKVVVQRLPQKKKKS